MVTTCLYHVILTIGLGHILNQCLDERNRVSKHSGEALDCTFLNTLLLLHVTLFLSGTKINELDSAIYTPKLR